MRRSSGETGDGAGVEFPEGLKNWPRSSFLPVPFFMLSLCPTAGVSIRQRLASILSTDLYPGPRVIHESRTQ